MTLSPDFLLALVSAIVAGCIGLGIQTWAIIRHLDGKREAGDGQLSAKIDTLHGRINAVKEDTIRRSDFDQDRQRTERELARLESLISNGFNAMNERFDRIFALLTRGNQRGE